MFEALAELVGMVVGLAVLGFMVFGAMALLNIFHVRADGLIDAHTFASCMGISYGQASSFLSDYAFSWRQYNETSKEYQTREEEVQHGGFGTQADVQHDGFGDVQHGGFGN